MIIGLVVLMVIIIAIVVTKSNDNTSTGLPELPTVLAQSSAGRPLG